MITLAIGAHPDDIEFGCGGTLRKATLRGEKVVHVIVTSGEEGGIGHPNLAHQREEEARASAKILGVDQVYFLREPDGLTNLSKEAKVRLIQLIREVRPQRVFIHSTSDLFPDHQIVSKLSLHAITAAAGPWYPGAGTNPHAVSDVYGFEVWHPIPAPSLLIDVSSVIAQKLDSLRAHQSQVAIIDYASAAEGLARYRGSMSMVGRYAEAFEVLKKATL